MSLPTKTLTLFTTTVIALSWLASSGAHADDIGNSTPHRRVVPAHHVIKAKTVALDGKACSQLIYDYGNKTETKTVCSPPWTGPSADAETGPSGSSSSTAQ